MIVEHTKLPSSWRYVPLKECCEIISGSTPSREKPEYWDGDIAWATPKDLSSLQGNILHSTSEKITQLGYKSCSTQMLPKGSVLFSSRAPIGLIAIAGIDVCTNQGFKSFIPGDGVDSTYLYYCLKKVAPQIEALGNGATFKEVSKSVVGDFRIPLPPLEEQKRIAAILDKADAIRRKRRQAIALTEELLRSAFLEMFGDPRLSSNSSKTKYQTMKLEDCVERFIDYRGKTPQKTGTGVPLITAKIIKKGRIRKADEFISEDDYDSWMRRGLPEVGDVLFTTEAPLGEVAQIDNDRVALAQRVLLLRGNREIIDNTYLFSVLQIDFVVDQILSRSTGTTVRGIRQKELRQVKIPVPPLDLQKKFASIVKRCRVMEDNYNISSRESDNLFHSLVQRAFRGELLPSPRLAAAPQDAAQ